MKSYGELYIRLHFPISYNVHTYKYGLVVWCITMGYKGNKLTF